MKVLLLCFALPLLAQRPSGSAVNISPVTEEQFSIKTDYDGSGYTLYVGRARAWDSVNRTTWSVGGSPAITQIVVSSNVATVTFSAAHGLEVGNQVTVKSSGAAALNASYRVASVPLGTTLTFATSGVSDGTYNASGMSLETLAPRTNQPVWNVTFLINNGSGQPTSIKSCGRNVAWDSRASLGCN